MGKGIAVRRSLQGARDPLKMFMKEAGGVNACAAGHAKLKRRRAGFSLDEIVGHRISR